MKSANEEPKDFNSYIVSYENLQHKFSFGGKVQVISFDQARQKNKRTRYNDFYVDEVQDYKEFGKGVIDVNYDKDIEYRRKIHPSTLHSFPETLKDK